MNFTEQSKDKKKIILITGMHRTGTSAMAGCFFNAGFNFGNINYESLVQSKKDNLKGHYENHHFVGISNLILKSINTNWHFILHPKYCKENGGEIDCKHQGTTDYPIDNFNLTYHQEFSEMVVECKKYLDSDILDNDNLVIKDPRSCIILPVYIRSMIERNDIYELYIIHMKRNDTDIGLSLNKRDGVSFDQTKIIIEKYSTLFEEYKNQIHNKLKNSIRFIDINFEDLVKNPIDSMKLIEKEFKFDILKNDTIKNKIIDFIDPDMKHF